MRSPACESSPTIQSTPPTAGEDFRRRVRALLAALPAQNRGGERRREPRFPFPYLIRLTPVASDGRSPLQTSIVVAGKHISEGGLGFFHPSPLPYRRVVATLSTGNRATAINVVVDLTWCRFTREGWYDGGGRFIEVYVAPDGNGLPPQSARQELGIVDRVLGG